MQSDYSLAANRFRALREGYKSLSQQIKNKESSKMSEFKNCESVCLVPKRATVYTENPGAIAAGSYTSQVILAADVEKLLESGVEVFGDVTSRAFGFGQRNPPYGVGDTHTGLLINIKPIVRDTAEQILKEMISTFDFTSKNPMLHVVDKSLIDRAKKLIERGS